MNEFSGFLDRIIGVDFPLQASFTAEMKPKGLFLWVAIDSEEEESEILNRIAKWA